MTEPNMWRLAMHTPADFIRMAEEAPTRKARRRALREYVRLTHDYAPSARELWQARDTPTNDDTANE